MELSDDTPSILETPTFHPLLHMGITLSDFCALPPPTQQSTALTALPGYLADKPPPSTILQALIAIGKADPGEIISILQPERFHSLTLLERAGCFGSTHLVTSGLPIAAPSRIHTYFHTIPAFGTVGRSPC